MPRTVQFFALIVATAIVQGTGAEEDGQAFTHMAGFELGVGTLTEIQRKLGPSTILKTGDAGEYEERLCYTVSAGTVSFLAGELGGRNNLTGFEITSKHFAGCSRWPAAVPEPKLAVASLYLGMPKTRFATALPNSRNLEDGRMIVAFDSKLPYTEDDFKKLPTDVRNQVARGETQAYWDVVVSVVGRFDRQKLTEIRIWQSVSN